MQVVYSGGSTPTPSPRVQRKQYHSYGRPLLPGYAQNVSLAHVHHRQTTKDRKDSTDNESSLRDSIPAMTKSVAITCLVLNILLPGLGTFVAGLTVLCGSTIRFKDSSKQKVICSNTWVAFLQFVTAFLFFLGWIWSIVWGVAFITISNDYYKNFKRENMPAKLRGDLACDRGNSNGTKMGVVNRTGSSPGLCTSSHLQKPIMLRSSSADQPTQQVIMLQKPPAISLSESSLVSTKKCLDTKTKQQKIIKRQMSGDELSPFNLTQCRLEQIVIHNLPRAPVRRGVLRRDDTVTSTGSNISEAENPYL